jgi:hypothetical protein
VHRVLKRQSGLHWLQPIHTLCSVNLLITHNSCNEASVQGLGRALPALISVAHRVCRRYLNLCNFICILLNKVHYLLLKPFNQMFNFSQNFWRAAPDVFLQQDNNRSFHRDTICYAVCPNIIHQASPHACLLVDSQKSQGRMQQKEYAKHTLLSKTSSALNCYVQRHTTWFFTVKKTS